VLRQVRLVAPTDATLLIQGETGMGKEVIAGAIHGLSPRSTKSLVKLNCAAIPRDLLESELFGHERGAFTGALSQRTGRFEIADKGTLSLPKWAKSGHHKWATPEHHNHLSPKSIPTVLVNVD
jgi:formate hydrogenlyase transcriptional activator